MTMWQRFTERARRVIFFAQEEAGRLGENYVSTEHVLLGLVRENTSVAARILDRMGVSLGRIRSEVERQVTRGDGRLGQDMQLTPRAKRVIDLAYDEARQLSNNYIGTEHLLLGLIREGEGLAGRVLAKLGVELERTRREVMALQDGDGGVPGKREPATTTPTHQSAFATVFAAAFEQLPAEDRAALLDDGLALNKLPAELQQCVQQMFEAGIRSGAFILDPNALVRVNLTKVDGATHYTVTTKASFLVNFLTRDPEA
jgi:ATP-dependent Clp protease ATP-binding subunit ClpA